MELILKILINAVAVMGAAYLLSGVKVKSFGAALATAVVLAIVNATVGSLLQFFAIPITIITLGLFSLVIYTFMIQLTSWIYKDFQVKNFWWALVFGILMSVINGVLMKIVL
ncbi:MAG: phage holin family protein [Bacteroidota bacterium]